MGGTFSGTWKGQEEPGCAWNRLEGMEDGADGKQGEGNDLTRNQIRERAEQRAVICRPL